MRLVEPTIEWKDEHENYAKEWGSARSVPSSLNLDGFDTYESFLNDLRTREKGLGKWVPSSNYFLVNDEDRIIGMIDIRHELNEHLRQVGGHIGYGIRPSERRKGYATRILKEALSKCKELQINSVLVTCDEDNIGSAKVILKNGGIEDESFIDEDGITKRRFWIEID